jgi:AcrR family transcriptional regulator
MNDSISLNLTDITEAPATERRDAAENRARILAAAKELFEEQGVTAVTMNDIAQAAEVGKGTLYRRFANKGELCLALMDEQLAQFQNVMLARMRQMSAAGTSNLTQLEHFLDALVHFTEAHSPYLGEAQRAALVETATPHFWQYLTIRGLLQTAVTAQELPPGLDLEFISGALLAPLSAQYYRFQREERGFSVERISAGLQLLIAGLRRD